MTDADRIQALEDRVTVLEDALGIRYHAPPEWGLTPTQDVIVGLLLAARSVPWERMWTVLYGSESDPPETDVIRTQICLMRPKLEAHGVEVRTIAGGNGIGRYMRGTPGGGYFIPAEQKARLLDA